MSHWKIIQGSEEALYFLTATLVEWQYVFVEQPELWTFSSARNYILNDHSVLKIECLY